MMKLLVHFFFVASCLIHFESFAVIEGKEPSVTEYKNQERKLEQEKKAVDEAQKKYDEVAREKTAEIERLNEERAKSVKNGEGDFILASYDEQIKTALNEKNTAETQLAKTKANFQEAKLLLENLFDVLPETDQARLVDQASSTIKSILDSDWVDAQGAVGSVQAELARIAEKPKAEQIKRLESLAQAINELPQERSAVKNALKEQSGLIEDRISEARNARIEQRGANELDVKLRLFEKTPSQRQVAIVNEFNDSLNVLEGAQRSQDISEQKNQLTRLKQLEGLAARYKPVGLDVAAYTDGNSLIVPGVEVRINESESRLPILETIIDAAAQNSDAFKNNIEDQKKIGSERVAQALQNRTVQDLAQLTRNTVTVQIASPDAMPKGLATKDPKEALNQLEAASGTIETNKIKNPLRTTPSKGEFAKSLEAFKAKITKAFESLVDLFRKNTGSLQSVELNYDQALKSGDSAQIALTGKQLLDSYDALRNDARRLFQDVNLQIRMATADNPDLFAKNLEDLRDQALQVSDLLNSARLVSDEAIRNSEGVMKNLTSAQRSAQRAEISSKVIADMNNYQKVVNDLQAKVEKAKSEIRAKVK